MKRLITAIAAVSLLGWVGHARAGEGFVVGVGLVHSTADLANKTSATSSFVTAEDHSELGARIECWDILREHFALNIQANLGFFSETDKPGTGAPPNAKDGKYTQTSWSVRLGGDRIWSPLENTKMFCGPGLEFWSGKRKFEDIAGFAGTYETENTSRFSLHGHLGVISMIGSNWGISGQLGHRIGFATYEEGGAKATWWPSSFDGAMELVFSFGGK
jgi:hypothetical protein